jgi:hypothetical protein
VEAGTHGIFSDAVLYNSSGNNHVYQITATFAAVASNGGTVLATLGGTPCTFGSLSASVGTCTETYTTRDSSTQLFEEAASGFVATTADGSDAAGSAGTLEMSVRSVQVFDATTQQYVPYTMGGGETLVGTLPEPLSLVPLPAAAWLLLSGLGGLGVFAREKHNATLPVRVQEHDHE